MWEVAKASGRNSRRGGEEKGRENELCKGTKARFFLPGAADFLDNVYLSGGLLKKMFFARCHTDKVLVLCFAVRARREIKFEWETVAYEYISHVTTGS